MTACTDLPAHIGDLVICDPHEIIDGGLRRRLAGLDSDEHRAATLKIVDDGYRAVESLVAAARAEIDLALAVDE